MFVVLKGLVTISQRDGLGHVVPIVRQGPGQFLAEVAQLSGRFALVDGHAEEDVETLLVPPAQLRALIIAEADLGERIVRALILRRVGLIQSGASGPVLISEGESVNLLRIQNFLRRNGHPHHAVDAAADSEAAALLRQALAGRSFVQAKNFGAEILIPAEVLSLDCSRARTDGEIVLKLVDGRRLRSRTVVIARGARYRRPAVPGLSEFEGRGVWYWA